MDLRWESGELSHEGRGLPCLNRTVASLKSSRMRPFVWPRRAVGPGARSPGSRDRPVHPAPLDRPPSRGADRASARGPSGRHGGRAEAAATRERDPAPGAGDPEEGHRFFRQGGKSMRFQLIDVAKKEFPVQRLCKVLGVSPSGYFAPGDVVQRALASGRIGSFWPRSARPLRSRVRRMAGPA